MQNTNCCQNQDHCETDKGIQQIVQQRYGEICDQSKQQNVCQTGCFTGCPTVDYKIFAESYENIQGYIPEADLGLGCGTPTLESQIKQGDLVLDLGSGAGIDSFAASALVGEKGKVIGVDITPSLIRKAQIIQDKHNVKNVEFRHGDITNLPILDNFVDVIISNGVINLVPEKQKVFQEIFRVLKPGGQFSFSDVFITNDLPKAIKQASELHVGCISGALKKAVQLQILEETGFIDIQVKKEKIVQVPDELLLKFVSEQDLIEFKQSGVNILSCTIFGRKK